ncbi:NAD(P)/FAD-dependent oxidoreductase [Roseibium sp. RKSG952]|uniref:NAD(P)/FAD-dependent oxidoreductase n=1 Tax=Roseibium sp. RKSG952 TaxID=2529384 RepID=UPI0012BD8024|nr:FAD-dependent oxidoreductase [Roseibium sp. RKSG952]MTI00370.1 FAD-binding protein [Roseibium sp. RKSG952]
MLQKISQSAIAVIGAGMAGLTAAGMLQEAGFRVTVFDKGRGPGGRMAVRRTDSGFSFDHGAQFFTARNPDFHELLGRHEAVSDWHPVMASSRVLDTDGWRVGVPAMNALPKALAAGLDLRVATQVVSLQFDADGWKLRTGAGEREGPFDLVLLAVPAPQALGLAAGLDGPLADTIRRVAIDPCWAVMAGFREPLDPGYDVFTAAEGAIAWMAFNNSKPGRPRDGTSLVIHASPDWSRVNLELDKADAAQRLLGFAAERFGQPLPEPVYLEAHRWRYAKTRIPAGRAFLASETLPVLVCGDWCLGARVEYAFESGRAAALALIET